jgi:endonuclease/exonuclease/phosphatase family metal-dependent hydrolase
MNFSIIYWNIWLDNQIHGKQKAKPLVEALDSLIETYDPDCFGLNEVLRQNSKQTPFVLDYLEKKGYEYSYYLASGPWTKEWNIGDAIVSKYPFTYTGGIVLGDHYTIDGRDPDGTQAQAAEAEILLKKNVSVRVIAAHLMNLRVHKLPTHFRHQKSLALHIANAPQDINLIAGGDFNEFKVMPFSFARKNRKYLHARTGVFPNMTWHKSARKRALLRANPDKLFWSKNDLLRLTDFKVIPDFTSDHKPLYAKFSIRGSS